MTALPPRLPRRVFIFYYSYISPRKIESCEAQSESCVYFSECLTFKMKVLSLLYAHWLSEEQIQEHQCSDRVWVPTHMFQRWIMEEDVGTVVIATLEHIGVCVYGAHSGATNVLYAPEWICRALKVSGEPKEEDADDYILPIRAKPPQCTFLKVQPLTSAHVRLAEQELIPAEDILSRGFERYTCWSAGQSLQLLLTSGDILEVEVMESHPPGNELYCLRGGEIEMDLLTPLDSLPDPESLVLPISVPVEELPLKQEEPPAPKEESHEEKRRKMAAAALARLSSQKEEK